MGADLLIAVCRQPHYEDESWPSREDAMDVVLERARLWVESQEAEALESLADIYLHYERTEAIEQERQEGGPWERTLRAALVDRVVAAANAVVPPREDGRLWMSRELTWIALDREHKEHWFITGGMSWGDTPTDMFPHVEVLDIASIWDAPVPRTEKEEVQA